MNVPIDTALRPVAAKMNKKGKRPTIRDVAALAGVSKSLVSLVYSSPEVVSEHRKERVLEAAAKLGFSPNFLARSLAAETGTFVGILVADLHNPLFAEIVDFVRAELEAKGQYGFMTSAMLSNSDGDQVLDRRTVSALIDLRPKSVLVVGSIPDMHELAALPENVQIVVAGAIAEGLNRASTVRADDAKGISLILDHLIANGHSNVGYISVKSGQVSKIRRDAYTNSMKKNGLAQFVQVQEQSMDSEKESYESALQMLKGKTIPSAIICFNDLVAIGVQQAVNEHIAKGGKPVALVGYDNTYLADLKQISLTSVDHGTLEIAKKAAELLTTEVTLAAKLGITHLLEPKLIVRNSSTLKVKVKK
ncbi:MAG: LacI family DNA-binding transcriptional regulator [Actinobacteria bacterium]|nr:LacI family DNA-binding transcriptional regulator [Actinomycetota bacterium]